MRTTGHYERTSVAGEEVAAFVPAPLPPRDPPLDLETSLRERLHTAEAALARLELAGAMVPSLDWFIYAFVRKEAVLSSQIEGTQASLVDLLAFEAEEEGSDPDADVEEVCNYLDAVGHARTELASPTGLPLSIRLLGETHRRLLSGVRGGTKQPGELRRSQNWVGGSRPGNASFVPPPPHLVAPLLSDLERYIHHDDGLPPLVRAGLVHVQFETIHPYLDGNGRIGRLLVALLLEHWGLLSRPLLYLSLFFKRHRFEYYRRLDGVRTTGDWEGWLDFFLDGVGTVSEEAVGSAKELHALVTADGDRLLEHAQATVTALRLFKALPKRPILTVGAAMAMLETSRPTAARAMDALVAAGILEETTGRKRDRTFAYSRYLDHLKVGTELDVG